MVIEYQKEGKTVIFTINRPEAMNAMNPLGIEEFHKYLIDFREDPEALVGIITGAGDKAFCAGADIKETLPFMKSGGELPPTILRGLEINKPIIAAVNGLALGGGLEFALAADIRIASENARFGVTEVNVGLIPGWGGTQRLPRLIGTGKAAEMLFTGKIIDASEAYHIGLINAVVPLEKLMSTAKEWAESICRAAPLAVRATKEAIYSGLDTTLDEGLRIETKLLRSVEQSEDFNEGVSAFSEKRKPNFKGK
ncbi:MAG: enoyl-CoA hydratase/isomerase family protein [Dehalococcoidales bacterium]|nr:enoyl-CoA hydratase/isomerase family protein [Dehalococcoidales bacterium]